MRHDHHADRMIPSGNRRTADRYEAAARALGYQRQIGGPYAGRWRAQTDGHFLDDDGTPRPCALYLRRAGLVRRLLAETSVTWCGTRRDLRQDHRDLMQWAAEARARFPVRLPR